jgi:hypothetical protein
MGFALFLTPNPKGTYAMDRPYLQLPRARVPDGPASQFRIIVGLVAPHRLGPRDWRWVPRENLDDWINEQFRRTVTVWRGV